MRAELPAYARQWWDAHPADIAAGVIHCGRLERYLAAFVPRLRENAPDDAEWSHHGRSQSRPPAMVRGKNSGRQ